MKKLFYFFTLCLVFLSCLSCQKEEQVIYANQEKTIEHFISNILKKDATYQNVENKGINRIILQQGEGDSASVNSTIRIYYALFLYKNGNMNNLISTNNFEVVKAAKYPNQNEEDYKPIDIKMSDKNIIKGLKYGLEGVKAGEICYIIFPSKFGFGDKNVGGVPENSILLYQIWVESINN